MGFINKIKNRPDLGNQPSQAAIPGPVMPNTSQTNLPGIEATDQMRMPLGGSQVANRQSDMGGMPMLNPLQKIKQSPMGQLVNYLQGMRRPKSGPGY